MSQIHVAVIANLRRSSQTAASMGTVIQRFPSDHRASNDGPKLFSHGSSWQLPTLMSSPKFIDLATVASRRKALSCLNTTLDPTAEGACHEDERGGNLELSALDSSRLVSIFCHFITGVCFASQLVFFVMLIFMFRSARGVECTIVKGGPGGADTTI